MMAWHRVACAGVLALGSLGASAHRPWLLPSSSVVDGDAPMVSVDAALSEDLFKFDTNGLELGALQVVAPDGSTLQATGRSATRRRTSFDIALPQKGTYRITGVTDSAFATWKAGGETKRWRGAADALATAVPADAQDLQVTRMLGRVETFVTNESPSPVPAAASGPGLALQPLSSPTDLSAGDTTRFRLTLDGQPLADADVTVIRGDNRYRYKLGEIAIKTGPDGSFAVTWPEAGQWWLGASHGGRGGPDAQVPGAKPPATSRRESYSATFEVLPK